MSDEQDVVTPGWIDPRGRRTEGGATAVVPGQRSEGQRTEGQRTEGQRTEGQPTEAVPPLVDGPPAGPPGPPPGPPSGPPPVPPGAAPMPVGVEPRPAPAADPTAGSEPELGGEPGPEVPVAQYPTAPVGGRPRPRLPRREQMTRMGPFAPVAGAAIGLLLGVLVVLLLAPAVDTFDQRLALVFVVLGLSLLGAGGTLLADEVRLLRRGAQAAEARASGAGVIAGLLNGLTPARLLITASAFMLLLSAYVTSGT